MTKIKLTTLKDKSSDDELLLRLKTMGVKIKDKAEEEQKDEQRTEERKEEPAFIEKRLTSTIIRRRIATPQREEEKPLQAEKETVPPKEETQTKIAERVRLIEEQRTEIEEVKRPEPSAAEEIPKKEEEKIPETRQKVRIEPISEPKPEIKVKEKEEELRLEIVKPEAPPQRVPTVEVQIEGKSIAEFSFDRPKGDFELIGEEKEKEITRVLEEAYGKDLDVDFTYVEEEEDERKRRKVEKLLRRFEELEIEEERLKKKILPKRKVLVQEEIQPRKKQKVFEFPVQKGKKEKRVEKEEEKKPEPVKQVKKTVKIGDEIQVGELAKRMGIKVQELIGKLLSLGVIATINQKIDFDTAYLVAQEFGCELEKELSIEEEFFAKEEEMQDRPEDLKPRPPVVTIMGHVDHGKTLLLDTIRHTNVAEKEAGGITQHIGAYMVNVDGKDIIFLDTPGHEAFTAMRARGAQVTDIVVLVVAADDGVMPQTIEAINHAKAASCPIVVAINKIDKPNANPEKVMKDLAELGLVPEEWGGNTLYAKISAKKKIGIKELLELIILQAEMLELKANPNKPARGVIIESKMDKGHGPVGTVIIQEGTLKVHDPFIAGTVFGRVRAMFDDKGQRLDVATPSMPVLVTGFSEVPQAGDKFIVTSEEKYAKELSKFRLEKLKEKEFSSVKRASLEDLYVKASESEKVTLNVIIKSDTRGTADAICEALKRVGNEKVEVNILHSGVGAITETDVNLAMASGAIILGFNTKPVHKAKELAERENIEVRTYSVIYDLIDDVKKALEGRLKPKIVDVYIGKAEVRKIFHISKVGTVAGCFVSEGKVLRSANVKLIRNGEEIFSGKVKSLKRFKDDVKEVAQGYECGIALDGTDDIQEGDILQFYVQEKEAQRIEG
ncbi:MAG: translation initiation factor IF-2 [Desulfobacterota bacterium]|nr:translation initiation factor IF-2 [Thermodesulfobacteriota bacterium]MDW8001917.1 translation initiation factor IF-2 [Deltaproteobacteria bacterium]